MLTRSVELVVMVKEGITMEGQSRVLGVVCALLTLDRQTNPDLLSLFTFGSF
jgi:hypothetical protein